MFYYFISPAIILVHGTLNWQQLQLLISRSTTPDLFKMQLKLEEFFNQQFKSSKRVFSNLYTSYTANAGTVPPKPGKTRKEGCFVILKIGWEVLIYSLTTFLKRV